MPTKTIRFAVVCLFVMSQSLSVCAIASSYLAHDLVPLPGFESSIAKDVNSAGYAVGYCSNYGGEDRACMWRPDGTVVDLGALTGTTASVARSINEQGVIAGNIGSGTASGLCTWTVDGGFTNLSAYVHDNVTAYGINANSQIVGRIWNTQAFAFDTRTHILTMSNTLAYTWARGINDGGQVIGYMESPNGGYYPVAWPSVALTWASHQTPERPYYPDFTVAGGNVEDVNSFGQIVGRILPRQSASFAAMWDTQYHYTQLWDSGGAFGINDFGQVVGVRYLGGPNKEAVAWTASGGLVSLGASAEASAISNAGQIIGYSSRHFDNGNSYSMAVRWDPVVPEPSGLAVLSTSLLMLPFAQRYRSRRGRGV